MQRPGIEPGPPAWQASILPLNQRCLLMIGEIFGVQNVIQVNYYRKTRDKNLFAVGRIRTYAPRGNLISSQTP